VNFSVSVQFSSLSRTLIIVTNEPLLQMSDNADVIKDMDLRASNERALRILRDSLNDARAMLGKSLGLVADRSQFQQPTTTTTTTAAGVAAPDEATQRMIESMLERYSEQLSTQVCELFERKLADMKLHHNATKL
jgi:hypothetical protein